MRTSIDFSDDVFRKLKSYAAMKGMSLKRLLHKAVERELAASEEPKVKDHQATLDLPKVGIEELKAPGAPLKITGAELAEVFRTIPKPDPGYWDVIEEAIRNQPPAAPPDEPTD